MIKLIAKCGPVVLMLLLFKVATFAQLNITDIDSIKTYNNAETYFEQGNYNQAMLYFDDFIKQQNKNKSANHYANYIENAYFYTAVASKKLNNDDARQKLLAYVELYPDGGNASYAYFHLGEMEYQGKRYREAISAFEKVNPALLSYNDLVDYRFEIAYSYFANKEFDKALRLFKEFKDVKDKYYHQSNYYYAYITYLNKDYDTALESFQRVDANALYKNVAPYYITYIYYQQGKFDELLKYAEPKASDSRIKYNREINQLIGQTHFNAGSYAKALPFLERYVNKAKKVRKEDIYQLAFAQYQTEQYGAAIRNFEELTILDEEIAQVALYSLADCYLKTNQKEKARNAYAAASQMKYDLEIQEIALLNYGKLSYEIGYHNDAIKTFNTFIETYPKSAMYAEAQGLLSQVFETTKNYKQALTILDEIPNLSDNLKQTYQKMAYLRGLELHKAEAYDKAFQYFELTNKYPMDNSIANLSNFWKADILFRNGKFGKSRNLYKSYLKNPPQNNKLSSKASPALANYTIGYTYFKQEKYGEAKSYFEKATQGFKGNDLYKDVYGDALLRAGDCAFVDKKYKAAGQFYNQVFDDRLPGADYALFQNAIITGLSGDDMAKVSEMQTLISGYPRSVYVDDAAYEIGEAYLNDGNYDRATATFEEITKRYKKSVFAKKALIKLGLISYNQDKNARAMDYYKQVVKQYPNTIEAKEALAALQDLYIVMGDPSGYIRYVKQGKYANITDAEEDSITYLAAESKYAEGNCNLSIGKFTDYLLKFRNGNFVLPAHFYRAECRNQEGDYENALKDYDYVIQQPVNIYTEQALMRGTKIAFSVTKNYEKAYQYFTKLYDNGSTIENLSDGLRGIVKTAYYAGKPAEFERYAKKLLSEDFVNNADKAEIFFFRGKIAYDAKDFTKANYEFDNLFSVSDDEKAAEAKYLIAKLYYNNKEYAQSKATCFELANNYGNYDYWVVSSFLLLADLYIQTDEIFQAKATLSSIVNNYEDGDLLSKAKQKLKQVEKLESQRSKIISESDNDGYLKLDTINNQ